MALLVMFPLAIITAKAIKMKRAEEPVLEVASSLYVIEKNPQEVEFQRRQTRIETMRSEANQLQAELSRIRKETNVFDRLHKTSKWKLKSDIHHSLYDDLYLEIGEFRDDVTYDTKLTEASTERDLD